MVPHCQQLFCVRTTGDADRVVKQLPNETEEQFVQRRNKIYLKPFMEKGKQGIQAQIEDRDRLQQLNNSLRRDNERLEGLLASARHAVSIFDASHNSSNKDNPMVEL